MKAIAKMTSSDIIIQAGHRSLAPATRRAYERDLQTFFKLTGKGIEQATPLDIAQYIDELAKHYRNTTINRKVYALSKVFSLYQIAGRINRNPVRELARTKRIAKPVEKAVKNVVELADVKMVTQKHTRTALIIRTLATTGLRVSELINIKKSDIEDFRYKGRLYKLVHIRKAKGGKERDVYLSDDLYRDIVKVFNGDSDYLFHSRNGEKLNRINLYSLIKRAFRKTGKNVSPHDLRHFYATHKIAHEKRDIKSVSLYLGHSKPSITLEMYVDTTLQADGAMIEELESAV